MARTFQVTIILLSTFAVGGATSAAQTFLTFHCGAASSMGSAALRLASRVSSSEVCCASQQKRAADGRSGSSAPDQTRLGDVLKTPNRVCLAAARHRRNGPDCGITRPRSVGSE
jgi:hypothetical protein